MFAWLAYGGRKELVLVTLVGHGQEAECAGTAISDYSGRVFEIEYSAEPATALLAALAACGVDALAFAPLAEDSPWLGDIAGWGGDIEADEGATEFDFLRGREPYKYLWVSADRPTYRRTMRRGARAEADRVAGAPPW
jgi:hypothetical protein